ncbi:hypothetical protein BOX30_04200 [Leptospirillum ferriphilum]|jgi:hypothetical protein|nr:hypothetical protein BOX30_04200 [Leptospirillum ferriphilum]
MSPKRVVMGRSPGRAIVGIVAVLLFLFPDRNGFADSTPMAPAPSPSPSSGEKTTNAAGKKASPSPSRCISPQQPASLSTSPAGCPSAPPVPGGGSATVSPATKPSGKKPRLEKHALSRNGADALDAYRHTWNPITGGPEFLPLADTLPEGEFNARMFFYSRFTEAQYTGSGGITSLPPGYYQTQLLLLGAMYFGLSTNDELLLLPSMISTFSSTSGVNLDGTGFNDFTFGLKHRWVIQDPDSWRPSISTPFLITLPTTTWFGTPVVKGGLPPISVVPSTHFGSPAFTTGLFLRKNRKPFRFLGDFYYTFNAPNSGVVPGRSGKQLIQYGDLAQYRMGVEQVFDDKTGFGGILEFVGLSGLPFSIDGIAPTLHPTAFNLMAMQPTIEYNLTPRLMFSAGVLLPVFGNNEYLAVTPNFSLWYYWGAVDGKLMPR